MLQEFLEIYRRVGKFISGTKLELAEDLEERLGHAELYIASLRRGVRRKNLTDSLSRQYEIIDIIGESDKNNFGLYHMELMGVLAIRYAIDRNNLLPYAKAFAALANKGFLSSGGETAYLRRALQQDLVSKVNGIIQTTDSTVTSIDILQKLGYKATTLLRDMVSTSLNLLEIIKKVVKLPHDSTKEGSPSVWINSDYRQTEKTIPNWNYEYIILTILQRSEGLTKDELAQEVKTALGKDKNAYPYYDLKNLIHAGLVRYESKRIRGIRDARIHTVYYITPSAKVLVELTQQNGYLDERLRRILL